MHATYIDTFPATWDVYINFFIVYRDSFDAKLSTEVRHGVFEVLGDAFSKLCKSWRKDKERPDGITCKYWRIAFLCSKLHKIIGTLRFAFLPPTCNGVTCKKSCELYNHLVMRHEFHRCILMLPLHV